MKSVVALTNLLAFILVAGIAAAQETGKPEGGTSQSMTMPKPGEETKALAVVFSKTATWTGDVPAGALGPNSPALKSHGRAVCRPILGGLWYSCDVTDTMGSGKDAMTWKGQMLVGYDLGTKAYRAMVADNLGTMAELNGTLDGTKFVLETPNEVMMMGQMMKDRLTWDFSDPKNVKFTDEHKTSTGDWTVFESATMKPVSGPAKAKAEAADTVKK